MHFDFEQPLAEHSYQSYLKYHYHLFTIFIPPLKCSKGLFAAKVVPYRKIYNKIISKQHIHYPQLLGTSYTFSGIISYFKKICHFYARENNNANFIPTFVRNDDMR